MIARNFFVSVALASVMLAACAERDDASGPVSDDPGMVGDLEATVASMAGIGWAIAPTFSPDGNRVAYVSSETPAPQVWIHDRQAGASHQVTFFDDTVSAVEWSPAGNRLAVAVAPGGGMNVQIYLTPADRFEPRLITAGGKTNNWLSSWSKDGRYLAFSSNAEDPASMHSYIYDTANGETSLLSRNDGIGRVSSLSPNGLRAIVNRVKSRGDNNLYLIDTPSGREQLLTPHEGVAVSGSGKFVDDDTVLLNTNIDREMIALGRIEIDSEGNIGDLSFIAGRDDAELSDFEIVDEQSKAILAWNNSGKSELAILDLDTDSMRAGPALPAEIAGSLTASPDSMHVAMSISGSASPPDVWLLDVETGAFSRITSSPHDGVDLASLVRPELRRYKAHDGLELTGWLYMPAGASGPVPTVTSFHGGPEGQERPRFRSTYQALLVSGIAVFAPNVRGSSGFGKTFVNLDNGALRFDGIRDIESTVGYLVSAGIADPEHIGIMGGSYGGYMVMAGLAHYPDLFSAGANLFGVVNFETFFANTEPWMAAISTIEYGDPVTEADLLRRLSPIHMVDEVVAPTIVLHGANDTNVPVVEAEQVVESLESRGVPVKYVLFPDEGHGWRKTENRITSDVAIVRWFDEYL